MKHTTFIFILVILLCSFIHAAPVVRIRSSSGGAPSSQTQATDTSCTATAQVTNKTTGVVSSVGTITYETQQGTTNRLTQSGINIEFSFTYADNLDSRQFAQLFTYVLGVSQDYITVFQFNVDGQGYRILLRLLDRSEFTSQQLLNKLDQAIVTQSFDNIHFYNVCYQIKNSENSQAQSGEGIEVPPPVLNLPTSSSPTLIVILPDRKSVV